MKDFLKARKENRISVLSQGHKRKRHLDITVPGLWVINSPEEIHTHAHTH